MSEISYLKYFLKDYRIGAVAKSSKFTIAKICKAIDFSRDIILVEYGPGDGVITKAILQKMTKGSKLIAIETNDLLVKKLLAISDNRLIVIHDCAENIPSILKRFNIEHVNYVVSGIPFTFFKPDKRRELVSTTKEHIVSGGKFIVYQYSPRMSKYLKESFGNARVRFIPFNLPSYFLMEAVRTG